MQRLISAFLLTCCAFLLISAGVSGPTSNLGTASVPGAQSGAIQFAFSHMVAPGDELQDPAAPILLIGGPDNPFSAYYTEILKAEGLNLYTAMPAQDVTAEALADRRVVLLVSSMLPAAAITALEEWVRSGDRTASGWTSTTITGHRPGSTSGRAS